MAFATVPGWQYFARPPDAWRCGSFDGEKRLIYRTKLTSNETDFHFQLTRFRFPVLLAFVMTIINKSQGHSLTDVSIDLRSPVFSHGQLYVALSRATDVRRIATLIKESNVDEVTDNIVYPEVLQGLLWWLSFFPLSFVLFPFCTVFVCEFGHPL